MTDMTAALPRPKVPIWHTAYDAYRLGIGAIFSSGVMFRFFVYGSVSLLAVFGVFLYGNLSMSGLLANTRSPGSNQTLVIGSSFLLGIALYALIAAIQTPMGVAVQRYVLLGDSPKHSYFAYLTGSYGLRFFWVSIAVYAYFCIAGFLYVPIVYLVYQVSPFRSDGIFRHACRQSLCIDGHHVNLDRFVRSRQLVGYQNQLCIRNRRCGSPRPCSPPRICRNSRHYVAPVLRILPAVCSTFPCLHGRRYRSDD